MRSRLHAFLIRLASLQGGRARLELMIGNFQNLKYGRNAFVKNKLIDSKFEFIQGFSRIVELENVFDDAKSKQCLANSPEPTSFWRSSGCQTVNKSSLND